MALPAETVGGRPGVSEAVASTAVVVEGGLESGELATISRPNKPARSEPTSLKQQKAKQKNKVPKFNEKEWRIMCPSHLTRGLNVFCVSSFLQECIYRNPPPPPPVLIGGGGVK